MIPVHSVLAKLPARLNMTAEEIEQTARMLTNFFHQLENVIVENCALKIRFTGFGSSE